MGLKYTPKSENQMAPNFSLPGVDGKTWRFEKAMGKNGLLVMFICNHCPYVKSIQKQLIKDTLALQKMGVQSVAIMSNDTSTYPEDSFEAIQKTAQDLGYPFPYLLDESQEVAKAYGAVCTPDFFGINREGVVKYRGRLNAAGINDAHHALKQDLVEAMREMVETGEITAEQHPSMGCSIKWKTTI